MGSQILSLWILNTTKFSFLVPICCLNAYTQHYNVWGMIILWFIGTEKLKTHGNS